MFPDLSAGAQLAPTKYGPAIVIGLGKAGEIALRQWLDELAEDPAGPQQGLRVMLITRSAPGGLPESNVKARLLHLEPSKTLPLGGRSSLPANVRSEACLRFRQAANYHQFTDWLGDCILSLRSDIRIFIIGSLAEQEIGILGDLLQIVRILPDSPGKRSPYTSVTALLSLDPAGTEKIPAQDIYASLREIGRFSYNGPHVFETSFSLPSLRWDAALLDQIFLIENRAGATTGFLEGIPYERGGGQAIAEFLFTMTHPAARPLWQDLSDELYQDAGGLHQTTHKLFVHSFGAASLYVPISILQTYIASRLAMAAIYGERPDVPEGLLARKKTSSEPAVNARMLGQRWLLTGPCQHPIFDWLLKAQDPAYFRRLPSLAPELESAFKAQLAHGLASFLNDPAGSDLDTALLTLEYLKTRLDQIDGWFKAAPTQNPDNLNRLTLQGFLNNWRLTIKHLSGSLSAWQKVLARRDGNQAGPDATAPNWRNQSETGLNNPASEGDKSGNIWESLQAIRKAAESDLQERARDQIYRPVTADKNNDLAEAELYYEDSIRPELSRYIKESNTNFTRVRERVEWWINLAPGRQPELLLLCWPADYSVRPGMEPSSDTCFTPANAAAVGQALMQISRTQVKGSADTLAGAWFENRLRTTVGFLKRASNAYLAFDEDLAFQLPNAASRNSYLLARDLTISHEHLEAIFPTASLKARKPLGDGEKTRLTALTFRLNIPVETIFSLEALGNEYINKAYQSLHLFRQESNSTVYEKRIWEICRERVWLPPECGINLVDQQLVTLFWQALIAGLVEIRRDQKRQNPQWTLDAISHQFPEMRLESPDLKAAFKYFVLESPFDPKLNEKPVSPFHSLKRSEFLAQLQAAIKERIRQPGYEQQRENIRKNVLEKWQAPAQQDWLEKAFSYLLKVEFDEPVWKGW